jgi:serine/threonine protein kinase
LINAECQAVLADFGLVFIIDSADFTSAKVVGTCRWTAPELMLPPESEEESPPEYSFASDVFAFAMTIVEVRRPRPFLSGHNGCAARY